MSINLNYILQCRERIAATARAMLDEELSYIEGIRLILNLLDDARLDRLKKPFIDFVTIDSETDHVPIGKVRDKWSPEARIKHAAEWARAENCAKVVGKRACLEAIAWLAANQFDGS